LQSHKTSIGAHLKQLRLASEYRSLRSFAKALGKTPSWWSKVESGEETPGADTLAHAAALLKVDADELLLLAGRLPADVKAILLGAPGAVPLVRAVAGLGEQAIEGLTGIAEGMRETI
jgi:transcriptional regulator with XRE-family HTH domain